MAWVRIDDQAPRNKKLLRAGPSACWLWVCGLAYCQSQLSDGFIPSEAMQLIGVLGAARVRRLAQSLVDAGLWEVTEGGYRVHDYLAFNATKEEALERSSDIHLERSKSGRAGGLKSGLVRREANEAKLKQTVEANAKQTVEANRSPIPSHPIQRDPSDLSLASAKQNGLSERAGKLLENYQRWYAEKRNGAKTRLLHNSVEFLEACDLVGIWDDDRLEKLAKIVLTATTDDFITRSDRGWKIFVTKAGWADDRLKQWELENRVKV